MCITKRDLGLRTETYHLSLGNFKSPLSDIPSKIYQSRIRLFCFTPTDVTVQNQSENMMFTDLYVRGRSAQRGAVTDTQWQSGSENLWLQMYVRVMVGDSITCST